MSVVSLGVLRVPEELALADEVNRAQFFSRCRWAADEIERLLANQSKDTSRLDWVLEYCSVDSPECTGIKDREDIDKAIDYHAELGFRGLL